MMSTPRADTNLFPSEALAAGTATLVPDPGNAPLATTLGDVGGVERTATTSRPNARALALVPGEEGRSSQPDEKRDDHPRLSEEVSVAQYHTAEETGIPSPRPPLSRARLILIAAIVTCTMVMSAGANMSLNIALPTIQIDLDMRETDLQWLSSAYSLTSGCFLLLSGRMADVHGRKLVFICGLTWYAIWTLAGGFMKTGAGLVVTRALAGSGAAMSVPSAIGIIATNFHGRSRSTAFAAFSAGAPVGGGIGLMFGGVLTSYAPTTWRATLWVFASLAAAIAATAFVFLMRTPDIIALLIVSILMIIAFFFWERHVINDTSRPPLIRLKLFTRAKGRLASVYFIGFMTWMGFVSLLYHATLFFQQVQGEVPIGAMLRFIPCAVSGLLCNVLVAYIIGRIPTQWIVCVGVLATGLASVFMAIAPADVSYWRYPFQSMWMGVMGADFLMATGSIFVSALSLADEQSVAGALFQTLVQLGGAFGLALTTVISDTYQKQAVATGHSTIESLLSGLHAAFWLGAGFSFASLLLAMVMLRGMGSMGVKKKTPGQAEESTGIAKAGEAEGKV